MSHTIELSKCIEAKKLSNLSVEEIILEAKRLSYETDEEVEACLFVLLEMIRMEIVLHYG